jgi:hypothetical protein
MFGSVQKTFCLAEACGCLYTERGRHGSFAGMGRVVDSAEIHHIVGWEENSHFEVTGLRTGGTADKAMAAEVSIRVLETYSLLSTSYLRG